MAKVTSPSLHARESHLSGQPNLGLLWSALIPGRVEQAAGTLTAALGHLARATDRARTLEGTGTCSGAMVGIFEAEILHERNDLTVAEQLYMPRRTITKGRGSVANDNGFCNRRRRHSALG